MNDDAKKVQALRADFPILNRPLVLGGQSRPLIYFDNAATTQKPRTVINACVDYYENSNANVHRAIHSLGEEATRLYESAREKVQHFIGAESSTEIIFTKGTTDSLNLMASSFTKLLNPGDVIITTEMEHHANLVPWQIAAEDRGIKLLFIPFDETGRLEVEKLNELWSDKVKLLTVAYGSNVLGTVNPIAELAKFAHDRGVPILVDGAQSVPHRPTDVKALDIDFLAFSSHKMCGPTGIGVLYGKKDWLEKLPPYQGGGDMIRSVWLDHFEANVLPYKFEAGTPNMEAAVGLGAAIDYLTQTGMEWIHSYESRLTQYAMERIQKIPRIKVYGTTPDKGAVIAFTLQDVHAHDLSAFLDQYGIAVRAGHHCAHPLARKIGVVSTARASFSFYNTFEEIDQFLAALEKAAKEL